MAILLLRSRCFLAIARSLPEKPLFDFGVYLRLAPRYSTAAVSSVDSERHPLKASRKRPSAEVRCPLDLICVDLICITPCEVDIRLRACARYRGHRLDRVS